MPAFGASSTPAFGFNTTPTFGSTPTTLFGNTGMAFGASSTPAFGSQSTPAFGAPSTSLFGSSSTPAFGGSSTPSFGSSGTPAFGGSSTSFSFGSAPSFGQSAPTFGSGPSPFGTQPSPFGAQTSTPAFGSPGFGQSAFGSQGGGSRVSPYTATSEPDASGTQPAGKLESISAMPTYKDKSHEELRWEDYQRGDKGGPNPAGQQGGITFPTLTPVNPLGQTSAFGQTSTFGQTSAFGQPAANPFSSTTSSNPFAPKPAFCPTGFTSPSSSIFSSPFSSSSSSPFGSTSSTTPLFGAPSLSGFVSSTSPSIFGGGTTPRLALLLHFWLLAGWVNVFFWIWPSFCKHSIIRTVFFDSMIGQTPSPFGQSTGFQQSTPNFGSSLFSTPSTGFGGSLFSSSTPSLSNTAGFGQLTPSLSTPFQLSAPAQASSAFSFSNFGQPQTASSGGFGSFPGTFNLGSLGQSAFAQSNIVMQPPLLQILLEHFLWYLRCLSVMWVLLQLSNMEFQACQCLRNQLLQ
ncbi:hypothetical protein HPP92_016051 [Vanilla planifolia]|uniref:Uncharacterized protein n=1 Tax=Vanilla planifolia TaxID=51239 RepID=A0A835QQK4_VANPL|nr:hypothetical protein HPP92_016051 [Vanilla planifolia]